MRGLFFGVALALAALCTPAAAQDGTLRIGLTEDPDLLDPTLGSSYVGRIVYAAMCDKLFDLDTHLNIVKPASTSNSRRWNSRPRCRPATPAISRPT